MDQGKLPHGARETATLTGPYKEMARGATFAEAVRPDRDREFFTLSCYPCWDARC